MNGKQGGTGNRRGKTMNGKEYIDETRTKQEK